MATCELRRANPQPQTLNPKRSTPGVAPLERNSHAAVLISEGPLKDSMVVICEPPFFITLKPTDQ